jgi:hypothetical protein
MSRYRATFSKSGTWPALLCGLMLVALGCGPSGPRTCEVRGSVTFDGKPIKDGSIVFVPTDPKLGAEGGSIKEGRYQARAKEGKNKVQITALDIGPNTVYVEGNPIASNFIPEKYNERTELEVDVRSDTTEFDFDLVGQRNTK